MKRWHSGWCGKHCWRQPPPSERSPRYASPRGHPRVQDVFPSYCCRAIFEPPRAPVRAGARIQLIVLELALSETKVRVIPFSVHEVKFTPFDFRIIRLRSFLWFCGGFARARWRVFRVRAQSVALGVH
jgi:hypothetical protein